jgi:hypothetical protein
MENLRMGQFGKLLPEHVQGLSLASTLPLQPLRQNVVAQ